MERIIACNLYIQTLSEFLMIEHSLLVELDDHTRHVVCTQALRGVEVWRAIHVHHHLDHSGEARKLAIVNGIL